MNSIFNFVSFWYFRYLMVTELYMVEKWERAFINIVLLVIFLMLSYFNYTVLLYVTSSIGQYVGVLTSSPQR